MKLGFVCTNYNNTSFTRAAIASLARGGRAGDVRAVVVDNRSRDEEVAALTALAREFPMVELVLNPENLGYFPGLNVGLRHLRERYPEVEHVVAGNNDLTFPPGFLETVEAHRGVLDRWAVVAPDLVTPGGVHQNPHVCRPIGRLRKAAWDLYFSSHAVATLMKRGARLAGRLLDRPENKPDSELFRTAGPIEQGYGACYLIGPAFFRHFTELYAPTFMMQEEYFLGEQLKLIGQSTYYEPRIVVEHHGHATTSRLPGRRQWEIGRAAHLVYKDFLRIGAAEQRRRIAAQTAREATAAGATSPATPGQ